MRSHSSGRYHINSERFHFGVVKICSRDGHFSLYSHIAIPATRNIGISQLRSSSMPNARLLDTAPNLPRHTIMHTAAADTCVGKTSTATLVITKFAVAAIRENTHAVTRICSEDLTKYMPMAAVPAISIVVTGREEIVENIILVRKSKILYESF